MTLYKDCYGLISCIIFSYAYADEQIKCILMCEIYFLSVFHSINYDMSAENLPSMFTNWPVQSQKKARILKFQI